MHYGIYVTAKAKARGQNTMKYSVYNYINSIFTLQTTLKNLVEFYKKLWNICDHSLDDRQTVSVLLREFVCDSSVYINYFLPLQLHLIPHKILWNSTMNCGMYVTAD